MKIPALIYRYRWLSLTLLLVLAIGSLFVIPKLKIDISFADYFSEGDPELTYYESFKDGMGTEDNYLLVAVIGEEGIFKKDFLSRINSFTKSCRKVSGVISANSITTLRRPYAGPMGMIQTPYLDIKTPENYPEDSLKIAHDQEFTGPYVFPEAQTLNVLLEMDKSLSIREVGSLVDSVQTLITPYEFSAYHLGGLRYLELSYFRLVQREMKTSIFISLVFIGLVLFLLFRSVGGVLIPLGSMLLAMLLLYGYLAVFERPLGVMANLFPTIVLIIGISNVIHIGVRYEQEIKRKATKREAILKSIRVIGTAIFLTSLTTAIGFFTLRISSMPALKDFGLDAAVAVIIAYLVAMLFVPGLLSLFPSERAFINPRFQGLWDRLAKIIHDNVYLHPQRIITVTLILLCLSYWGIQKINTNNKMIMSIPESERARDDFRFFDNELGGVRSMEYAIETQKGFQLNQLAVLNELEKLHQYLQAYPRLHQVQSPVSHYQGLNKIWHSWETAFPESNREIGKQEKKMKKYTDRMRYRLVDSSKTMGRLAFRLKDPGRHVADSIFKSVDRWIGMNVDTSLVQFRATGTHLMVDRGHAHRVSNMFWGMGIALVAVALLMGLLLRNFRLILLSLFVNLVPLIMVGGVMGFLDIELRGSTSIIFTVGFVIAVDSTIHFLSQYSIRKKQGMDVDAAIKETIAETGKAIFSTTVILLGGFLVLMHSQSWEIYIHGLLVGLILGVAFLADMLLVPVLLRWVELPLEEELPDAALQPQPQEI